jgi:uncharacterized Rmd1/YagE family protein
LLDEEIERNELRDYHDEYIVEADEHSVVGGRHEHGSHRRGEHGEDGTPDQDGGGLLRDEGHHPVEGGEDRASDDAAGSNGHGPQDHPQSDIQDSGAATSAAAAAAAAAAASARLAYDVAEMFVFGYGVVVFWNFTERQEKDVLADLAFATSSVTGTPIPLATMPLHEEDFETEEFHFEYSTHISRPRVYNDMITLRSGDHMIKLAISHGIAQSTKLCFFEEVMARQMAEAKDVPRRLAISGKLGMKREEVFRILGRLFKSRVEVNLCMCHQSSCRT